MEEVESVEHVSGGKKALVVPALSEQRRFFGRKTGKMHLGQGDAGGKSVNHLVSCTRERKTTMDRAILPGVPR